MCKLKFKKLTQMVINEKWNEILKRDATSCRLTRILPKHINAIFNLFVVSRSPLVIQCVLMAYHSGAAHRIHICLCGTTTST